jgi:hypothetical protein
MSETIQITGTAHAILDLQTFPSGFSKQILVIKTDDDKYPQTIPVEFMKDKTAYLLNVQIGQPVTAYVNLRGNEHNGKYYASIQGWKLDKGEPVQDSTPASRAHNEAKANGYQPAKTVANDDDEIDDLPF